MTGKPVVLIVDDEAGVRESVRMVLKDDWETVTQPCGEDAIEWLKDNSPDLAFLDILMPGIDGLEVLEHIREGDAALPVVMLTATKTVRTAVKAMKLGAFDYITKPFDVDELRMVASRAIKNAALLREVDQLRSEVGSHYSVDNMIGESSLMQDVFNTVGRVAPLKTTVLISGESGTGKELIAKAIHYNSPRASETLVTINCAAIPDNLLESELFGHEKGSFTDASAKKTGQFEIADKGTLFLDEIGEMSPSLQAKLLRVLEEGEIMRVGGSGPLQVDVRVVAATHRDLRKLIDEGAFRADLYYRLNVVTVTLPPLRDRPEDIPLLIRHFVEKKTREHGLPSRTLGQETVEQLLGYPWPGNVRELENVIERTLVLAPDCDEIGVNSLPPDMAAGPSSAGPGTRQMVLDGRKSLNLAVDEFEKDIIEEALSRARHNQTRAARTLGTTRRILKYRMDKLGIEQPDAP